jgi:membrane-associated phospholipid phosphatase
MSRRIRKYAAVATAGLALHCVPALASDKSWDDASSIGRDVLVVAALGLPTVQGDWNGTLQAGGSIAAATLVSTGLKEAFPELRPDGSDRKSFPSGHTAVSFAAAATLQNRYGWEVGVPAQLVAAFVGVARVKADKHHWYDVAAGAAIGEASGFLITSRHDTDVRVFPWGDTKGAGLAMAVRF